jgi:hypothetical protein
MQCEICKTIEKLGLDASAHDLWFCADEGGKAAAYQARPHMEKLRREFCAFLILRWRHRKHWMLAHQRRLVTLGL